METRRQDRDILSQATRQGHIKPPIPWSAGRRNLHTRRTMVRERSRVVKIKNIKKQNLLYGCFKKQSTQKISNQKMKLKERDKSILEYVQCMYNNVHAYKVPGF